MQNPTTAIAFDLIHSPIKGRVLLEASAGTGKTFSVTKIALRHLLADGLKIREILLMTFTKLATAELNQALIDDLAAAVALIRAIKHNAAAKSGFPVDDVVLTHEELQAFEAENTQSETDATSDAKGLSPLDKILLALLGALSEQNLRLAPERLNLALQSVDLASVMTLHSFAGRVIQEHAFGVKLAFGQLITEDRQHYEALATADFIRVHYIEVNVQLPPGVSLPVLNQRQLKSHLAFGLNYPTIQTPDMPNLSGHGSEADLQRIVQDYAEARVELESYWQTNGQQILAVVADFKQFFNDNGKMVSRSSLRQNKIDAAFDLLESFVAELPEVPPLEHMLGYDSTITRPLQANPICVFSSQILDDCLKKNYTNFPWHPLIGYANDFTARFEHYLRHKDALADRFLIYSIHWLQHRYQQLMSQDYVADESAAIQILSAALSRDDASSRQLAAALRAHYPVAIVDEFQDTDPVQFGILSRIYSEPETHHLLMVGDPKQAIYRFRGADIYAYLSVLNTVHRSYYLETNYRSDGDLVAAVNALFAETNTSRRSFLIEGIDFKPVKANHQSARLIVPSSESTAAFQWRVAKTSTDARAASKIWSERLVQEIRHLTNGDFRLVESDQQRAVLHQDIAILVNSNNQARQYYQVCQQAGIPAIIHSDTSILQTPIATALLWLLHVILEGPRADRLNALLVSVMFERPAATLQHETISDESVRPKRIALYQDLVEAKALWMQRGIATALQYFFEKQQVNDGLISRRRLRELADLEQLVELLHVDEQNQRRQSWQLLQWYEDQLSEAAEDRLSSTEHSQRRLDTDLPAVTIITVHKSKGLEYPIVIYPSLKNLKAVDRGGLAAIHADASEGRSADDEKAPLAPDLIVVTSTKATHLSKNQQEAYQAQRALELRAENLRSLYVALTRASTRTIVFDDWSKISKSDVDTKASYHLIAGHVEGAIEAPNESAIDDFILGSPYHHMTEIMLDELAEGGDMGDKTVSLKETQSNQASQPSDSSSALSTTVLSRLIADNPVTPTWVMTSFSGLTSHKSNPITVSNDLHAQDESPLQTKLAEAASKQPDDQTDGFEQHTLEALPYRHIFPAGPSYGTLLHQLFEDITFSDLGDSSPACVEQVRLHMSEITAKHNLAKKIDIKALQQWLSQVVNKPVFAGQALHELDQLSLAEMEFTFPITSSGLARFSHVLLELEPLFPGLQTWLAANPLFLHQAASDGYLKGFIDLTVMLEGQFGLVDYKSNQLGTGDAHYTPEKLREKMLSSGYWLQFVLYSIAIHRWLQTRIPEYDYDEHVLGGWFLFVRGIDANTTASSGVFFDKIPKSTLLALSEAISQ